MLDSGGCDLWCRFCGTVGKLGVVSRATRKVLSVDEVVEYLVTPVELISSVCRPECLEL